MTCKWPILAGMTFLLCATLADADPPLKPRPRIFITRVAWRGDLGGFAGADAKCLYDTNNPLDSGYGHWKALLAGNNATSPGVAYYRRDGSTIIAQATTGNLVEQNELQNSITTRQYQVRTGAVSASSADDCEHWTSSSHARSSAAGISSSVQSSWWLGDGYQSDEAQAAQCSKWLQLYCVEQ